MILRLAVAALFAAMAALCTPAWTPGAAHARAQALTAETVPFEWLDSAAASAWASNGTGMLFVSDPDCENCRTLAALLEGLGATGSIGAVRCLDSAALSDDLSAQAAEYLSRRGTSFANVSGPELGRTALGDLEKPLCGFILFFNKGVLVGLHVGADQGAENALSDQSIQDLREELEPHLNKLGANPCPGHC